ncbi:MAG: hypothetical protein LBL66_08330 [Clostridiales bacterium]|jgi:uncharacterized membrane protein|nr:hypothetical protein [Clostridiales bacterium]
MKKDVIFWMFCGFAAALFAADLAGLVFAAVKFASYRNGGAFPARGAIAFFIVLTVLNAVFALASVSYLLLKKFALKNK